MITIRNIENSILKGIEAVTRSSVTTKVGIVATLGVLLLKYSAANYPKWKNKYQLDKITSREWIKFGAQTGLYFLALPKISHEENGWCFLMQGICAYTLYILS